MNEAAGVLTRAKSELQLATVKSQRLNERAAHFRASMRDSAGVTIQGAVEGATDGTAGERERLARMLRDIGPAKLLARKLSEVDRIKAQVDSQLLSDELGLSQLVIETGPMPGAAGSKVRHYLRVRDSSTGEICLEWSAPRNGRVTDPSGNPGAGGEGHDAFTKKLHGAAG